MTHATPRRLATRSAALLSLGLAAGCLRPGRPELQRAPNPELPASPSAAAASAPASVAPSVARHVEPAATQRFVGGVRAAVGPASCRPTGSRT